MMRTLFCFLAAILAGPVAAADLNDRYSEMGRMTVEVGDQVFELTIPYDLEMDLGYAEQRMIAGSFHTINTAAREVNGDGEPSGPTFQVTLQHQGGGFRLISAEIFDERGFDEPMVMGPDGGTGALTSHNLEGDRLTAEVQGTFVRLTGYGTGEPKPISGEAQLPGVIKWQVTLPPLE